jgi:hypothetical protein
MEAMRRIERVLEEWIAVDRAGEHYFPHEFMYKILRAGKLKKSYQIDLKILDDRSVGEESANCRRAGKTQHLGTCMPRGHSR